MKIKIGKEQISYLSGLDSYEAKKEFLMDHILLMLEASLDKKTEPVIFKDGKFTPKDQNLARHLAEFHAHNILYKEETNKRNYTIGEIVDKVTELSVDKIEKENLLKFDLPKQESLSKKQLKDITNPIDRFINSTATNLGCNANGTNEIPKGEIDLGPFKFENIEGLSEEKIKELHFLMQKGPIVWSTLYTKEDLEKAFDDARSSNPITGALGDRYFKYYNFEDYFEKEYPSK